MNPPGSACLFCHVFPPGVFGARPDVAATPQSPRVVADPPRRILFIGNSLTYSNDGIYSHLQKLTASAVPPMRDSRRTRLSSAASTSSRFGNSSRNRDGRSPAAMTWSSSRKIFPKRKWQTSGIRPEFVEEIRKTGARPVLLMAWAYRRLGWISMAEIAQAHREVGKELGVDVAPVGLAWERVTKERPGPESVYDGPRTSQYPRNLPGNACRLCHSVPSESRRISGMCRPA